jgi:hypothetical protein
MAWSSTIGSHQDPKKLPKTIEKFMPLGGSNSANKGVSEEQKQNYLNEYKEYLKKINNG